MNLHPVFKFLLKYFRMKTDKLDMELSFRTEA